MKMIRPTESKGKRLQALDEAVVSKRGKAFGRWVAEEETKPRLAALRGTGACAADAFTPVLKDSEIEALGK